MNAFTLKIIASICMFLDHTGAVFSTYMPPFMRWVGRLSFPIYAYLIADGCSHTRNINKYMLRLGIFALISEIPFDLAFNEPIGFFSSTNIFYTFFFSVACINVYEKFKLKLNPKFNLIPLLLLTPVFFCINHPSLHLIATCIAGFYTLCVIILSIILPEAKNSQLTFKSKVLSFIPAMPIIALGDLFSTDYGSYAVILVFALYLAKTKRNKLILLFLGLAYEYSPFLLTYFNRQSINGLMIFIFAVSAVAIISFYNGKQGKKLKWVFYWFYPLHISLIVFISILFT